MQPRFKAEQSSQKLRGGYYTPQQYSDFIAHWVLQGRPERILEPSCGDGVFIKSVIQQQPQHVFSMQCMELDPLEAKKARQTACNSPHDISVSCGDFLDYALAHIQNQPGDFDGIVGNPPYIRYQFLDTDFQEKAAECFRLLNLRFTKLSNAWVVFVILCVKLLAANGRLGMVIPSEVLHVLYAQELRSFLAEHCARIMLVNPVELWFKGAMQGTVMLLVEKKQHPSEDSLIQITTTSGDTFTQKHAAELFPRDQFIPTPLNKWLIALLRKEDIALYQHVRSLSCIRTLGEIAKVSAAITTGANEFFTVPQSLVQQHNLARYCSPVFSKSHHCAGIIYDQDQHQSNLTAQESVSLVRFAQQPLHAQALAYIQEAEQKGLHQRYKCRVRDPWYVVPEVKPQAATLNKFSHVCPKLISNQIGAFTTDGFYTVNVQPGIDVDRLVVLFFNPLTMISAELEGRYYGGGILEIMPSEAMQLAIPYPDDIELPNIRQLDRLIREQGLEQAVYDNGSKILKRIGLNAGQIEQLFTIWQQLGKNRKRKH